MLNFESNFFKAGKVLYCMRNTAYIVLIFTALSLTFLASCSDNPQTTPESVVVFSKPGLVDSLTGTCSTFLIRSFILDTLDFSGYRNASIKMNSFADGDLSEIGLYYINSDTAVFVFRASGVNEINSQSEREFSVPDGKKKYILRMKLFSSVCTGQLFSLRIRDFYLYGKK